MKYFSPSNLKKNTLCQHCFINRRACIRQDITHISWITFWIKKQNTSIDHRWGCPNNSFAKLYITIPIFLLCSFFLFFGLSRFLIGLTPPPNFRLASYATVKILYKIRVINNKAGVIKSAWSWFYKDTCNLPVFLFVDQLNDMHH